MYMQWFQQSMQNQMADIDHLVIKTKKIPTKLLKSKHSKKCKKEEIEEHVEYLGS